VSGTPQGTKPAYKVQIEDEAWEGLSSLPESQQDKVFAFNKNHLQHHPTQPIPGHLKRLKGDFSAYFQFEVTQSHRMIYTVDESTRTVYVEYIGPHPNWKRRRSRPF